MYKLWWMKKENNYGDLLTPYIFDHFNIPYVYTDVKEANTLCIGSIIVHAKKDTLVLGSGLIKKKQQPSPLADYRIVRGPLTRNRILELGGSCPEIYGDPALLLPLIWEPSTKEHEIGIVPHIYNYTEVKEKYSSYKIIDLTKDPKTVTQEITSCKKIISSSLHGIIVSHAYGIPAAWVKFETKLVGDDIKFKDYYASFNKDAILSTVEMPVFTEAEFDISKLVDIFEGL